ncbi:hypothetical protein EMIT0P100_300012 [Pseudomonas sp. IT-P100]
MSENHIAWFRILEKYEIPQPTGCVLN